MLFSDALGATDAKAEASRSVPQRVHVLGRLRAARARHLPAGRAPLLTRAVPGRGLLCLQGRAGRAPGPPRRARAVGTVEYHHRPT